MIVECVQEAIDLGGEAGFGCASLDREGLRPRFVMHGCGLSPNLYRFARHEIQTFEKTNPYLA